jgi:hypothetical protein
MLAAAACVLLRVQSTHQVHAHYICVQLNQMLCVSCHAVCRKMPVLLQLADTLTLQTRSIRISSPANHVDAEHSYASVHKRSNSTPRASCQDSCTSSIVIHTGMQAALWLVTQQPASPSIAVLL